MANPSRDDGGYYHRRKEEEGVLKRGREETGTKSPQAREEMERGTRHRNYPS